MDTDDSTYDPAYTLLLTTAKGWLRRHPIDLVNGADDQARPFVEMAERAIYEAMRLPHESESGGRQISHGGRVD